MEVCQQQYIGSPLILTSICSGTVWDSVINSLLHRAKDICSNQNQLEEEQAHIQKVLSACKYPVWAINRMKIKNSTPRTVKNTNRDTRTNTFIKGYITVPYNKGLGESFKNICKRYGIQVHFKSGKTLKDELVAPKDKDHIKKSGIIYRFK